MATRQNVIESGVQAMAEWQRGSGRQAIRAWSNEHLTTKGDAWLWQFASATMTTERARHLIEQALEMGY